jgi:hypothetical protein
MHAFGIYLSRLKIQLVKPRGNELLASCIFRGNRNAADEFFRKLKYWIFQFQ